MSRQLFNDVASRFGFVDIKVNQYSTCVLEIANYISGMEISTKCEATFNPFVFMEPDDESGDDGFWIKKPEWQSTFGTVTDWEERLSLAVLGKFLSSKD